jgi:hypothetical protein
MFDNLGKQVKAVEAAGKRVARRTRRRDRVQIPRSKDQISNLKLHGYIVKSLHGYKGRGCAMSEGISNLRFQISNRIKAPNTKHTST